MTGSKTLRVKLLIIVAIRPLGNLMIGLKRMTGSWFRNLSFGKLIPLGKNVFFSI